MNAAVKLNEYAICGAVAIGVILGGLTSSWLVFLPMTGGQIGSAIYRSDIRLQPTKKTGQRRTK